MFEVTEDATTDASASTSQAARRATTNTGSAATSLIVRKSLKEEWHSLYLFSRVDA
jgi:hypothetical protein